MTQTSDLSELLLPIQADDHIQGDPDAAHTLVEYGDYECPECGRLFTVIRDLQRELRSRLRIVFRHFPRSGAHPHAQLAAEAAEAAGAQGRFWDMHELLFENQNALTKGDLLHYAERLGLDLEQFRRDLDEHVYEDRVREDFRRGVQNGVYGTPGLFIDGVRYGGSLDHESLRRELEA
jgi:formate-nitrite transporter family protein